MIILNLVSPEQRRALKELRFFAHIKVLSGIVFAALLLAYGFLFGIQAILEHRLTVVQNDIAALEEQLPEHGANSLDEKTKELNDRITYLSDATGTWFSMSTMMNEIAEKVPSGITLENISVVTVANQITFSGVAANRNDLLSFQNNLQELPYIDTIDTPLSTFTQRENISFNISFTILVDKVTKPATL